MTQAFQHKDDYERKIIKQFRSTRQQTIELCEPLNKEDFTIQSMPDVSPPKWHLAHTTWFFEAFLLCKFSSTYKVFNKAYDYLFNSYYETHGSFHLRSERGLLSRPETSEVLNYRRYVDDHIEELLLELNTKNRDDILSILELGTHHEQQHQELLLMDIKYNFFKNPLKPAYLNQTKTSRLDVSSKSEQWLKVPEGIYTVGASHEGFSYDNESCRHKVYINPVKLRSTLVSNEEYLAFIEDGGYSKSELWLSEARTHAEAKHFKQPLYWQHDGKEWFEFTLYGLKPLELAAPVSHISYFEADAFARWKGFRLPTEFEWEATAQDKPIDGHFLDSSDFHPYPNNNCDQTSHQLYGSLWEWTSSSYAPYYGFTPSHGTLGEYNGKFMSNQYVLRGGCFATAKFHIRSSYRNFYPTHSRWMFSGIRLAKEFNSDD
jgi:ergothioneine biosynthesis protein EgtB